MNVVRTCGSWCQVEGSSLGGTATSCLTTSTTNSGPTILTSLGNNNDSHPSLLDVLNRPGLVSPFTTLEEDEPLEDRSWTRIWDEWLKMAMQPSVCIPLLVVANVAALAAGFLLWGRRAWAWQVVIAY